VDAERDANQDGNGPVRRDYAAPRLVSFGDLAALTAGQGSSPYDMEHGSDFKN